MPEDEFSLFDDYAARFARGERPEARAYLKRAGAGADDLAQLIDGYLARATPPPPSADAVLLTAAALYGRSPLLEARERRGLSRADVVDALIAALGLDRTKSAKVLRYYEELESAVRDPNRVDRRVFEALAETLRATASDLVGRGARRPPEGLGYLWAATAMPPPAAAAAAPLARTEPPDEIDRLFGRA
jgi:hypothetical protein